MTEKNRKPRWGNELLNACYFGNTGAAMKLIEKGADIFFVDPRDGWAGAHYAARFGKVKILETMLNAGLDVNMRTTGKETLLHKACRTNRTNVVLWLMKKGANPQLLNGTGEKASQLTTDPECIFICDHFEEYLQMAKDGKKFAKEKTILAVDPTFSNVSTGIVVNNYQYNSGSKDDLAQSAADEAERKSRELMYNSSAKKSPRGRSSSRDAKH